MLPFRLSKPCHDEEPAEITCGGHVYPPVPWTRVSDLLPLGNVMRPITWKFRSQSPLQDHVHLTKRASRYRDNRLVGVDSKELPDLLESPDLYMNSFTRRNFSLQGRKPRLMRQRIKADLNDSYGRECWYGGSCVKVVGDLVMFTGNDGNFRVSMMVDDDRGVFDQTPGREIYFRDEKLSHGRIYSIHPNIEDGDASNFYVGVRFRHGVVVYGVSGGQDVFYIRRLPSSVGLSSICWLEDNLVTVDMEARLLWDIATGVRMEDVKLEDSLHCSALELVHG